MFQYSHSKRKNLYDIKAVREQFPVLSQHMNGKPLVYLDSGATSQKPLSVIDSMHSFDKFEYATIHRAGYRIGENATKKYEATRKHISQFIGATAPEEVVFTSGTTQAINLISESYGKEYLREGDEILISHMEHHANIIPWQMLVKEKGAVLKVIPVDDTGTLLMDEYDQLLTKKTKIVSITHVSNALGTVLPIQEICQKAHQEGAIVVVDGAQSIPHQKIDVSQLDCDFFVFSGHKVYGPTGIGVLFGKKELLSGMPPYVTGGDMIKKVTFEETTFADPPSRFEAGTPPITQVLGLGKALEFLESIGMEPIIAHEHMLLENGTRLLNQVPGLKIIGTAAEKAGIISFVVENIHPHDLVTLLSEEGICVRGGHHCAQPVMRRFQVPATARASVGMYNTVEDFEKLTEALIKIKRIFD
ncbi:MAG: aminotransferase class V-fold PLP-dependent enzyme [Nitrospinota bacterium]